MGDNPGSIEVNCEEKLMTPLQEKKGEDGDHRRFTR